MTVPVAPPAAATAVLAVQQSTQQRILRAAVVAEILALWRRMFRPDDARASGADMLAPLATLVDRRRQVSAGLASAYYKQARAAAGVTKPFVPKPADPIPAGLMRVTQESTGVGEFLSGIKDGKTPAQAQTDAETMLTGSLSRLVSQGGRETVNNSVQDDSQALGWARITDANPCYFCAMLASRGLAYKSRESAGGGSFKFHNHDECTVAPVFEIDDPVLHRADELGDQWASVTSGKGGKAAVTAWRHHWEATHPSSTD